MTLASHQDTVKTMYYPAESNAVETASGITALQPPCIDSDPLMTTPPTKLPEKSDSIFSDFDLFLFGEGVHDQIYDKLGAHLMERQGRGGVNFSVWAPNARKVYAVGDFNEWNESANPMVAVEESGIWECFVPGACEGQNYKFLIVDAHGNRCLKSDPFGRYAELPPKTASVVCNLEKYEWQDDDWMQQRIASTDLNRPISIYEVHLGSWQKSHDQENGWMNYRDLARSLVKYCKEMGFTHVELMPIAEHPYTGSWGYQTVGYYSVTSRYGTAEDFMYFVDHCHQHGIGVIIDWVPAHFPRDAHGLARFDGTALYEHADPRQGEHPDWGTLIFNYGRNEVRNFLISNALYWFDKFHIDGIRVDAVASMLYLDYSRDEGQWIPNKYGGRQNLEAIDFLKKLNERIHADFPGVMTIAEESTAWSGVSRPTDKDGLGFSMKWNMGWMNDMLRYMRLDPVHRKFHHNELTFSLVYAFSENFMLPFSHDEVVHGKGSLLTQMPGDSWQKFANLRLLYSWMWSHPGKNLLFMSGEFAQWDEWNADESIQWDLLKHDSHRGVQRLVSDLNNLMQNQPALYQQDFDQAGFQWINCDDSDNSLISFIRQGTDPQEQIITVCNFTPLPRMSHVCGVPFAGQYREIFNSDSEYYGGTNCGNAGMVQTSSNESDGHRQSISINVPPLGAVMFKRIPKMAADSEILQNGTSPSR